MKWSKNLRNGSAVAATALALGLSCLAAPEAQAITTGAGATVFNKVTVTYASGSVNNLTASSTVSVAITTLASQPNIAVNKTTAEVLSGAQTVYTYTITSTSNGTDTYNISSTNVSDSGMQSNSSDSLSATSVTLWGSYAISSGAGFISVPGGSVAITGLTSGRTVTLAGHNYTVGTITPGHADSGSGEVLDQIALTPIGTSPAITATTVTSATQVGEYTTFTDTVTGGTVLTPTSTTATDGTHTFNLHVASTVTPAVTIDTSAGNSNQTITTILGPVLSIVKKSRNATTNPSGTFGTNTTAKPGEDIEYQITITNTHAVDALATISNAKVVDVLPVYTTYKTGTAGITYTIGGTATSSSIADATGNTSPLDNSGNGYTLGTALGGGDTAVITYKVTVN
ncbi:hypothetical protein [Geomonas sp.]|uniref:hypothetical protein n=1 Tax=Geomonas sp. TaxID=2651584 RepID=UPI002B49C584|nr:hypothetical protein [Geomonas sp.]HJV35334.1 hypothetical protein [Geomonas sp.]